ncbi:hypothetical protein ScPMuIL_014323 [Solemya velum]
MPSKKKKYNARFPPARIKKIMQTDEEVGKVASAVPVIISRALELFIESLILKTSETTQGRNAKTLSTAHIKQTIHSEKKFDFLRDLVTNIPDHQIDEDGESPNPGENKKHRVARPRKQRENSKRSQTEKEEDKSESEEEDDETESTESEDENCSNNVAGSTFPHITSPTATHSIMSPDNCGQDRPTTSTVSLSALSGLMNIAAPVHTDEDDYDT